ncbi:anthrone oxygenase family protein [Georgenia sp. MJ206]|uniref:anthrone oxygenase family protein n=1 Tax=Georgenia wangjunii TaxID=3117730 RepID=UPI002F266586
MIAVETVLVVLAAVGSGAVGGVFFTFDGFVLRALARLPGDGGADAMRAINVTAVRPPLMIAMFGTAALAVAVVVLGARTDDGVRAALLVGGSLTYLLGVIGTTIARNVPLNDALAAERTGAMWERYLRSWGRTNRVRTVAGLLGAAALTVGLTR